MCLLYTGGEFSLMKEHVPAVAIKLIIVRWYIVIFNMFCFSQISMYVHFFAVFLCFFLFVFSFVSMGHFVGINTFVDHEKNYPPWPTLPLV
jgi:uncharacterized membrane protein